MSPSSGPDDDARPLSVVGVDEHAETVYRHVLNNPATTLSELTSAIGQGPQTVRPALSRLEAMGLISASPTRPPRYSAMSPQVALEALVAHRLERLSMVRVTAEQLQEQFLAAGSTRAGEAVQLLTGPEAIGQHFIQMQQSAQRETAVLDRPPYLVPDAINHKVEAHALQRGVRVRAIYDHLALGVPGKLAQIRVSIAAGEQARLTAELPLKLALADGSALVPLVNRPDDHRALVIHGSALVAGLYTLFELLWQQAVPVPPEISGVHRPPDDTEDEREIATLLAAGLSDKAIARQLGVSLRTVARRTSSLMATLGAHQRFQAGVHAANRGYLAPGDPA